MPDNLETLLTQTLIPAPLSRKQKDRMKGAFMSGKIKITYSVMTETERKLLVLSRKNFRGRGLMIDKLVAEAWDEAVAAGLVTDAMLETASLDVLPGPDDARRIPVISVNAVGAA